MGSVPVYLYEALSSHPMKELSVIMWVSGVGLGGIVWVSELCDIESHVTTRLAYSSALGGSLPHFKASFRPPAFSLNLPLSIKIWSTCVSGLDSDATDLVIDQLPWSQQSILPIN